MKNIKKIISAVLLATILLLSACSDSSNSGNTDIPPATVSQYNDDGTEKTPEQITKEEFELPGPDGIAFVDGKLTERFTLRIVKPTQFNEQIFAVTQGFFDEVGIDVEWVASLPQGLSLAQAVATDVVDIFGSGHTTNIVQARNAGIILKIVNAGTLDSAGIELTHMTWFVREDSDIQTPADLKGKTIALTSLGGCEELWNTVLLNHYGLTTDDVEIVVISQQTAVEQALRMGQIDMCVLHGPNHTIALDEGGLRVLEQSYNIAEREGDGTLSAVGVRAFKEDFIAQHPAVVRAYVTAANRAQVWANANYEEALAVTAEFLGVEYKNIAGTTYTNARWVEGEKIEFWVQVAERVSLSGFETPGAVNSDDLWTNDYNPFYLGIFDE